MFYFGRTTFMTAALFLDLLKNPDRLEAFSFHELKSLTMQYPYCHLLRFLAAKKAKEEDRPSFQQDLKLAATYAPDRNFLYKFLNEEASIEEIDLDELLPPVITETITVPEVEEEEFVEAVHEDLLGETDLLDAIEKDLEELKIQDELEIEEAIPEEKAVEISSEIPSESLSLPEEPEVEEEEEEVYESIHSILKNSEEGIPVKEEIASEIDIPEITPNPVKKDIGLLGEIEKDLAFIKAGNAANDLEDELNVETVPMEIEEETGISLPEIPEEISLEESEEVASPLFNKKVIEETLQLEETEIEPVIAPALKVPEKKVLPEANTKEVKKKKEEAGQETLDFNSFLKKLKRPSYDDQASRIIFKEKEKKKKILKRAELSVIEDIENVSETLAQLLVIQGKRKKAIKMYRQLKLKFPEKSSYFAAKIDILKKN